MNDKEDKVKKTIRFTKKIVIFCIVFVVLYTIAAIVFQIYKDEPLSEVLTERVFTCIIGELAVTGLLKVVESVTGIFGNRSDEEDNEEPDESFIDYTTEEDDRK